MYKFKKIDRYNIFWQNPELIIIMPSSRTSKSIRTSTKYYYHKVRSLLTEGTNLRLPSEVIDLMVIAFKLVLVLID